MFLGLAHVSLLACWAGVVCVVSGAPAGASRSESHVSCLFHLQRELCALWLSREGLEHPCGYTPQMGVGQQACLHPPQSLPLPTATCGPSIRTPGRAGAPTLGSIWHKAKGRWGPQVSFRDMFGGRVTFRCFQISPRGHPPTALSKSSP